MTSTPPAGTQGGAKRMLDIAVSSVGLILAAPLCALIALAIRLDDAEAVLFRQVRIGLGGRPFTMLKFRSMRVNSEQRGLSITAAGDRRITRVGRFLRATKLDELPQLWNVLRGDMTLVGPRPEVPRYVDLYTVDQRAVLALKPGITDEATLEFRDEEALLARAQDAERFYVEHCIPRKIEINLAYARRASVWEDLKVILRTVAIVWLR